MGAQEITVRRKFVTPNKETSRSESASFTVMSRTGAGNEAGESLFA
jgi:hypothetical protein